jgi:F0F1-type ATP synthase delta subunit
MAPLKLPNSLVGQADTARLIRELNGLNDFFAGAKTRAAGSPVVMPRVSRLLESLAVLNGLNLLDEAARNQLQTQLTAIYERAPNLHISFAVEPSPKGLEQILVWMRQNIHPQALLQIGLQPAIAGGCMLRTTNKVFDMSLRTHLKKQSRYLTELLAEKADGS